MRLLTTDSPVPSLPRSSDPRCLHSSGSAGLDPQSEPEPEAVPDADPEHRSIDRVSKPAPQRLRPRRAAARKVNYNENEGRPQTGRKMTKTEQREAEDAALELANARDQAAALLRGDISECAEHISGGGQGEASLLVPPHPNLADDSSDVSADTSDRHWVGSMVKKHLDDGAMVTGKVGQYDPQANIYAVEYDNGQSEQVAPQQLEPLLLAESSVITDCDSSRNSTCTVASFSVMGMLEKVERFEQAAASSAADVWGASPYRTRKPVSNARGRAFEELLPERSFSDADSFQSARPNDEGPLQSVQQQQPTRICGEKADVTPRESPARPGCELSEKPRFSAEASEAAQDAEQEELPEQEEDEDNDAGEEPEQKGQEEQEEQEEYNARCRTCEMQFYTASGKTICVDCREADGGTLRDESAASDLVEVETPVEDETQPCYNDGTLEQQQQQQQQQQEQQDGGQKPRELRSRRDRKAPQRWAEDPLATAELGGCGEKLTAVRTESSEAVDDIGSTQRRPRFHTAMSAEIAVGTRLICVKKSQARAGFEMDTAKMQVLTRNSVIVAIDVRQNKTGALCVEFDGGWVSVVTSNGETAWKPHEENEQVSAPAPREEEEPQRCYSDGGTLRDENGFELEAETLRPMLHSTRNKMDPAFGKASEGFTGYMAPGLVESIEMISPAWPSRILMGEDDAMLDMELPQFCAHMERAPYISAAESLEAVAAKKMAFATYRQRSDFADGCDKQHLAEMELEATKVLVPGTKTRAVWLVQRMDDDVDADRAARLCWDAVKGCGLGPFQMHVTRYQLELAQCSGDIGLALLRTFVDSFLFDQYADPLDALNGDQLRPQSAILEIPKEPVRTFVLLFVLFYANARVRTGGARRSTRSLPAAHM